MAVACLVMPSSGVSAKYKRSHMNDLLALIFWSLTSIYLFDAACGHRKYLEEVNHSNIDKLRHVNVSAITPLNKQQWESCFYGFTWRTKLDTKMWWFLLRAPSLDATQKMIALQPPLSFLHIRTHENSENRRCADNEYTTSLQSLWSPQVAQRCMLTRVVHRSPSTPLMCPSWTQQPQWQLHVCAWTVLYCLSTVGWYGDRLANKCWEIHQPVESFPFGYFDDDIIIQVQALTNATLRRDEGCHSARYTHFKKGFNKRRKVGPTLLQF